MGNSTKELVNAFNLNNYFSDKINANFTVEGKKIVGLFASGTNIGEYLQGIGEKIIKRHYLSRTEVAGKYYNLDCFPFVLGANPDKEYLGNGIVKVKLAGSTNNEVIRNLKVHFANEFEKAVISKVVARLKETVKITEEEAYEWIRGTVQTGAIGIPYLYCIAFSNEYLEKRYFPKIFELFKSLYISEFNSRLENCGLKSSDFYEYKDDMLYIKDVSDKVVKSVTEYVKKEVTLDFRTPGKEDSKVENFKDVLSSLMSKRVRKFINTYDYDIFTDEKKIQNGNNFVLIPLIEMDDGQFETLSSRDASKINGVFNKAIPNGFTNSNFISDIKGKTANPQYTNCKEPVYAFSNTQIALLLLKIMESPIAYNQINGCFEFAVDLENFKRRGSSRSSSEASTPTHAEPPRTPPEQTGDRFFESKGDGDSGLGDSPPKKDPAAHSSSGDPGPSSKISHSQVSPPRQGSMLRHNVGAAEVGAAESGSAAPSAWTQQTNPWLSQGTSRNRWQLPLQPPGPGLSGLSWKDAAQNAQVGLSACSQPMSPWLSQSSNVITPSICLGIPRRPILLTTKNDPKSLSPEFSARSPGVEDVKSICNEEPEKQQVTDKSDRKSSDECSEAKSQKSESPKEHGGGFKSKIKSFFSLNFKPKQHEASLKRCDVGRDTTRSMPTISVTKKPPLSERSASERKAKSNSPSKVTPLTHEGAPGGLKSQARLDPDQKKVLHPFLSPEERKKLNSNSLSPGEEQHLNLIRSPEGKREIKQSFESQEENLRRSANAQLPSSDNLSSKKVNQDSGFVSTGSPAMTDGNASPKLEDCNTTTQYKNHTR